MGNDDSDGDSEVTEELILLSSPEVAFLRKVTTLRNGNGHVDSRRALRAIVEKLERLVRENDPTTDRFLLSVTREELQEIHDAAKTAYSFITAEERRARLVLREKMYVSSRRLGLPLT